MDSTGQTREIPGRLVPLRRVAFGLAFVFAGLALFVLGMCAELIVSTFVSSPSQQVVLGLASIPFLGGLIHLFGQAVCLWVPSEAQARGFLIGALALNLLSKAVRGAGLFLLVFPLPDWDPRVFVGGLVAAGQLLSVLSSFRFLYFLRQLSAYLGFGDSVNRAEQVLFLWGVLIILVGLSTGGLFLLHNLFQSPGVLDLQEVPAALLLPVLLELILVLALLLVMLITFVKYCNLLTSVRETILRQLEIWATEQKGKKPGLSPL
jgi:hypothetical protein